MYSRVATVALAALVALVIPAKADNFANFFDDANCSQNGGIGVDLTNPGCLNEAGRGSVYIPNTGAGSTDLNQYCLVKTNADTTCSCQSEGYDFTATGFCAVLDPNDQSYRFISGSCAANNC